MPTVSRLTGRIGFSSSALMAANLDMFTFSATATSASFGYSQSN
jgi:hypothetical protein